MKNQKGNILWGLLGTLFFSIVIMLSVWILFNNIKKPIDFIQEQGLKVIFEEVWYGREGGHSNE